MENVVVHIISHSHWDREWYLPFESHRMQLVELFDNLFDLFESYACERLESYKKTLRAGR